MTRPCPQCGEIHPVLAEARPKGRDRAARDLYLLMSRAVRVKRNEIYHRVMEVEASIVLYGNAYTKPAGLL